MQWIEKPKQWYFGLLRLIEGDTLVESTLFLLICAEFPCSHSLLVSVLPCFLEYVSVLWDGWVCMEAELVGEWRWIDRQNE